MEVAQHQLMLKDFARLLNIMVLRLSVERCVVNLSTPLNVT